jgi:hypothetical protein
VVSRPPRVAVFGGDLRKLARDLAGLTDLELFGSTGQTGQGELRRMLAPLRAGAVQSGLPRDPLGRPRRDRRDPQALPRPRRGLPQLPQHRRGAPLAAGRAISMNVAPDPTRTAPTGDRQ